MLASLLPALVALVGAGASGSPAADGPRPSLRWAGAPGCPGASSGRARVEHYLGGSLPAAPSASVELVAEREQFIATVAVDGAFRTLHARDCEHLAHAAALIVAVSLDPVAAAGALDTTPHGAAATGPAAARDGDAPVVVPEPSAPGSEPEPDPDSRPPRLSLAAADPTRATASASGRTPGGPADAVRRAGPGARAHYLGVAAGVGWGQLPALSGRLRVDYAVALDAVRLEVDALYTTPRSIAYDDAPDVGGRFQAVGAGLRGCVSPTAGPVTVPLCAGLEGGVVFGRGFGVDRVQSPFDGWVGLQVGVAAHIRVHPRVAIVLGGDVVAPLRRPAFHADRRRTLFRMASVGVRGLAGLEFRVG